MVIIRTEASQKDGFHRLFRCCYLASQIKAIRPVSFIINNDPVAKKFLARRKFRVSVNLNDPLLVDQKISIIILDLSTLGTADMILLERARSVSAKTVVVTDRMIDNSISDYLIVPSWADGKQSKSQRVLAGPAYALLHHKYRHFNRVKRKYKDKAQKIFLCLGGAPEYRVLRKVIDIIVRAKGGVKVAAGFYLKKSFKKILQRIYPGLQFVGKTESLARPAFEADLSLITPGHMAWEAAAVGTPAVYLNLTDEHEKAARNFINYGCGIKMLSLDKLTPASFLDILQQADQERRQKIGDKAKTLVDGLGIVRIIDFFKNQGII